MTDQTARDVTDDDRRVARDWAEHIIRTPFTSMPMEAAAARVILDAVPTPPRPSTLTVGSKWDDTAALTRACHESERDQIIALDAEGYAFVWTWAAEWWEGSAPPKSAPFTIIHPGLEAADAAD